MKDNLLSKKGSAFYLIYGLFFLLVLGTLFIVFNQITQDRIRPVLETPELNFSVESKAYADKYIGAWKLLPYIIVFIVGLYFIIWAGVRGEKDGIS